MGSPFWYLDYSICIEIFREDKKDQRRIKSLGDKNNIYNVITIIACIAVLCKLNVIPSFFKSFYFAAWFGILS